MNKEELDYQIGGINETAVSQLLELYSDLWKERETLPVAFGVIDYLSKNLDYHTVEEIYQKVSKDRNWSLKQVIEGVRDCFWSGLVIDSWTVPEDSYLPTEFCFKIPGERGDLERLCNWIDHTEELHRQKLMR